MRSVPLTRKFTIIPEPYQREDVPLDEVLPSLGQGDRSGWDSLVGQYRVVILADAGAGKTHELRASAERLAADGKPAFFIRIEDIGETFGKAFEVGTEEAFNAWLVDSGEAWFFLDSVDEIRLSEQRAFEVAIRAFAARIRNARHRAHIYISSRPYAWRAVVDRALIDEVLPFEAQRQENTGEASQTDEKALKVETQSKSGDTPNPPAFHLYILAALDDADIRQFAAYLGVGNIDAFLDTLERGGLLPLARLPFDLQDLIATWLETGALASRLAILQGGVRRQFLRDWAAVGAPALNFERASSAIRLIAIAAILTGVPNIRLPRSTATGALDAEALLPSWEKPEIEALLTTGVFGDPIYGEVRFRHREVRELLAAEWAADLFGRVGGRGHFDVLLYRTQYGEDILPPRLRALLPWLILFDSVTRDRVLATNPEIAIEGGDAALLPLAVRQKLLATLIDQVIAPTSSLRGLDNSAIARIAQRDLEDQVLALIDRHRTNDDALFVLGRLAWQGEMAGCVDALAKIASDPARGIYSRLVSIRAVARVGTAKQLYRLWREVNANEETLPRRLLAEFAVHAPADDVTVRLLLASIERLEARTEFEVTGLTQGLNSFVGRLPLDTGEPDSGPLASLVAGFQLFLSREPHIERGECRVSKEYRWLMGPALYGIERLTVARSPAALAQPSLAILAAAPALRFWHSDIYQDRKSSVGELVPAWAELNDSLFWWTVIEYRAAETATGGVLDDDWPISWVGHFWLFDASSFARTLAWIRQRDLADDRLVALSRTFRTYEQNGRPPVWLGQLRDAVAGDPVLEAALEARLNPPISEKSRSHQEEERKYRIERENRDRTLASNRARFVAEVIADPEIIRAPPGVRPGKLSNGQYNLLRMIEGDGMSGSRARGADWQSLIPELGPEVAEAYRDAAVAQWRSYKPGLRSEGGNTTSIPYALIFAMAGLDIELGDDSKPKLELRNARRAFRYAIWELNGFPRWFEALYRAWPKVGRAFIWKEVEWELANSPADEPLHYVLSDLVYYGSWLHTEIGPLLYNWLENHHPPNQDCLRYCRTIIVGGGATPSELAALARRKIGDVTVPESQQPTWYAVWADCEPAPAIAALAKLLASGTLADRTQFALEFVVGLLGGRRENSAIFGNFRAPTYLKDLYLVMHRVVPVADDIDRAGKGVYSPTLRDDAQDARERLLAMLTEIPGELTYRAILEIAELHPEPRYRDYIRARAFQHAITDGDLHSWTLSQVVDRVRQFEAMPSSDRSIGGLANAEN
ncbi:hypothetical protein NKH09_25760 [Mesorhizobium sp. M1339]|uniref:hypothetical protein n=1 Tax=unclassified Mesorhizobium TaxID=325217 RepID=UPI003338083E